MTRSVFQPVQKALKGSLGVPGDKSISHRAVMLAAIARGTSRIDGFLQGNDCLQTIDCFRRLGVTIREKGQTIEVEGAGPNGLKEPESVLDVGNSGTTARLLQGILAAMPFHSVIVGDESIARRPMDRVSEPLKKMGAKIDGRKEGKLTPISIRGGRLEGIRYQSPVASAQVKSALLFAGLFAAGETTVEEPYLTRDHTERMLKAFGVPVRKKGTETTVYGGSILKARDFRIPGDISSAAFFLVAGAIKEGSFITVHNVGINPTRTGIIDVLRRMGAKISLNNERIYGEEPVADITVQAAPLRGVEIGGDLIPRLIDEIPVIALLATQADGTTTIKDAGELKVKETNRIDTVVTQLKKLGANIEATEDGMIIHGPSSLNGGTVSSMGDHRIGMMLAIASCVSTQPVVVEQSEAIAVSYPHFEKDFAKMF